MRNLSEDTGRINAIIANPHRGRPERGRRGRRDLLGDGLQLERRGGAVQILAGDGAQSTAPGGKITIAAGAMRAAPAEASPYGWALRPTAGR